MRLSGFIALAKNSDGNMFGLHSEKQIKLSRLCRIDEA